MTRQKLVVTAPLRTLQRKRIAILVVVLLIGALYIAVPQLGFFDANWYTLLQSDWRFFALALTSLLVSFAAAASIYLQLSPKSLGFWRTYAVQIAGAFAGKVLPAGLGSISVNYLYLRKCRVNKVASGTVVAVNNLLGFVGHGLWLLVLAALFPAQISESLAGHSWHKQAWVALLIIVGAVVMVGVLMRKRLRRAVREIIRQLRSYRKQPGKVVLALAASMVLTACNIAIVWFSAQALQLPLGLAMAAIALTAGLLAQTVTPTPGGIGGVEAGISAGLVLGGLPLNDAVAVTILFRFITFWIPLGLGGIALALVIRRKLL